MQAMGFNCIKLWAVWNAVEKVPGEYDFADLDFLVALSEKYNLQVVFNLIPEGAPYWTYQGDTQDLYATADGQTVAYGGPANIPTAGWPGRCMDDQVFSDMVRKFIRTTAAHFSTNDTVIAFDVWNEPHLEPMYDYRSNMLCYCKHSQQAFIRYLKQKYQDLESLGLAWYRRYTAWEQVKPPTRFGTYPDMIDWRSSGLRISNFGSEEELLHARRALQTRVFRRTWRTAASWAINLQEAWPTSLVMNFCLPGKSRSSAFPASRNG
jgi:beta-galactosidase GanA